jgi:hypothetical protein
LRLDSGAWLEVNVEGAKLDRPFEDFSSSILIMEYITERVVSDDDDRVLLEVVL